MTARDKLTEYAASWIADCGESYDVADGHAERLVEEFRGDVLREAADFVRDAHFRDGLTVQEIGTALRSMADASTPTSKEPQR